MKLPADVKKGLLALGFELVEQDDEYQWWSKDLPKGYIDLRLTVEGN